MLITNKRFPAIVTLLLMGMQVILVFLSWILAAANPGADIRSLLSSDGIRWIFGTFINNITTPILIWLLLLGIAMALMRMSGLYKAVCHLRRTSYYERMALFVIAWELVIVVLLIVLLAFVPHAVLLSAVGRLWPSGFSSSIVPMLLISLSGMSATYGLMVGSLRSWIDVFRVMSLGIYIMAPYIIMFIVAIELYYSVLWVMSV